MLRALVFRRKPIIARRQAPTGLRVEDEAGGLLLVSAKVGGIWSCRSLSCSHHSLDRPNIMWLS
jgi:hypothetical protein